MIPREFGSLDSLTVMSLANNRLEGNIPRGLADLPKLRILALGSNRFTGCMPRSLPTVEVNDLDDLDLPLCEDPINVAPEACANGIAVPNPAENPGLVSDCRALIASRIKLAGTRILELVDPTSD